MKFMGHVPHDLVLYHQWSPRQSRFGSRNDENFYRDGFSFCGFENHGGVGSGNLPHEVTTSSLVVASRETLLSRRPLVVELQLGRTRTAEFEVCRDRWGTIRADVQNRLTLAPRPRTYAESRKVPNLTLRILERKR